MGSSPHDIVLTFGAGLPSGVFSGTRNRRFYQQPLGYGFGGGDDVTGVDDAGPAADLHLAEPAGGVVGGATSPRSSEEDDSVDTDFEADSQVAGLSAIVREILAPDFSTIVPSSAPETFGPLLSDISQVNLATMQTSGETLNDLLIASFAQVPDCLADYSQASADETYYNFWGEATKNGHVQDMSGPSGSCLHTYDTEMLRITPNFGTAVGGQLVKAEADIVGDINSNLEGLLVHPIEYLENVLPEGNADVFSSPGSASPVYSRGSVSIPRLSPVLFPLTPGRVEEESPEGNALSTSLESTLPHGQFRTMLPIKPEGRKEPAVPDRPQPPMTPVKPPPAAHSGGFTFIQEYNGMKELSTVGPTRTPKRGRRVGPLDQAQRLGARRVRNERIVCIRCRKDKQTCDGFPCSRCQHVETRSKQPCTKAHFFDIVESGTLNYISQRAHNHLTLDQKRRVRMELPAEIDIDEMLSDLDHARWQFDVKATQGEKTIFVLNLDRCYEYLFGIKKKLRSGRRDLRRFIDDDIPKIGNWRRCIEGMDYTVDLLDRLYLWNTMPSRATYSYIPKKSAHGNHRAPEARAMNILDDGERQHLLLAGQLSRIVCRKLEVEAYRHLQKLLNDASGPSSSEILPFVQNFGRILVTLRWRVSWWTLLGDGGKNPDAEKEAFEARVKDLCRILYFYYCRMRSKIPSFHSLESLKGIYSSYADTSEEVFDDFPGSESIEGFERWMRNGELLIEKAGVVKKLDRIGLRSERF